jgi:hypothetical protein
MNKKASFCRSHHAIEGQNIQFVCYLAKRDHNAGVTCVLCKKLPMHHSDLGVEEMLLYGFECLMQCEKTQSVYSYTDYIRRIFDKLDGGEDPRTFVQNLDH